jgi:4-hydroxy-tetrahydrodipicolinate synthase
LGAAAAVVASVGAGQATKAYAQAAKVKRDNFYVAAYTPVDASMKFDAGAYREMMAYWKSQGADGVLVMGSTGEGQSFSIAERKAITEAVGKNKYGLDIIVATGTPNVPDTIELSKHAADHGADSVLIVPPFYQPKPSGDGVLAFFDQVFTAVKTPVRYYHIPGWTEVPVTDMKVWSTLGQHSNFIGVKCTISDPKEFDQITGLLPDRAIVTGTDGMVEQALGHGNGAILASGNIFTRQLAAVWAAHRAGADIKGPWDKLKAAEALFRQDGYGRGNTAAKYALSVLLGSHQTFSRAPESNVLSDAEKANIRNAVAQLKAMS